MLIFLFFFHETFQKYYFQRNHISYPCASQINKPIVARNQNKNAIISVKIGKKYKILLFKTYFNIYHRTSKMEVENPEATSTVIGSEANQADKVTETQAIQQEDDNIIKENQFVLLIDNRDNRKIVNLKEKR